MKRKTLAFTAVVLAGSIGLGFQSTLAQDAPEAGQRGPSIPEKMQSQPPRSEGSAGASRVSPDDIKNVKEALKAKGIDPGPINGTLDTKAQQALRQFQKANDLPVTGSVDQQTALKLGVTLGKGDSAGASGSKMKSDTPSSSGREPKEKEKGID